VGFVVDKWHWDRFFLLVFRLSRVNIIPSWLPPSYFTWGMNNRPVFGRSSETWCRPVHMNVNISAKSGRLILFISAILLSPVSITEIVFTRTFLLFLTMLLWIRGFDVKHSCGLLKETFWDCTEPHEGYIKGTTTVNLCICIKANVCLSVCLCSRLTLNPLTDSNQIWCSDYSEPGEKHRLYKILTL
jgi:hypothetical protein